MKYTSLVLLILAVWISSCKGVAPVSATPELQTAFTISDGGLLTEKPCGPPCFMGVEPGNTVDEAMSALKPTEFYSDCRKEVWWIYCSNIQATYSFSPDKHLIEWIEFRPTNVSLGDVVTKYGPPKRWETSIPSDDSGNAMPMVSLQLYYDEIYTIIELEYLSNDDARYTASPESKVFKVMYTNGVWEEDWHSDDWHGYGDYQEH